MDDREEEEEEDEERILFVRRSREGRNACAERTVHVNAAAAMEHENGRCIFICRFGILAVVNGT